MVSDAPDQPGRRDAVRNRARLIEAAATAFSEEGLSVSVNAIARDAGVNVATLYRHFETKDGLVAAVLEAIVAPLETARDLALSTPRPGQSLAVLIRESVRLQREHQGLVDALRQRPLAAEVREQLRARAMAIVEPVVRRAHAEDELRGDLDAEDVLVALRMASVVLELPTTDVDRHLDIVLRGLRP
jgi:AcrR family transcriptional regulator